MIKEKLQHYVEFYLAPLPSSAYAIMEVVNPATSMVKIDKRSLTGVSIPEEAFGYRFVDQIVGSSKKTGHLAGKIMNKSPSHYFGKIVTLENIASMTPNPVVLKSLMEEKGYKRMVKTNKGNFHPLKREDIVLKEN